MRYQKPCSKRWLVGMGTRKLQLGLPSKADALESEIDHAAGDRAARGGIHAISRGKDEAGCKNEREK